MERLYPMDFRAYEVEKRELWFDVFEDELNDLHNAGFVHHHVMRPSNIRGQPFDNVFLTSSGIRLIDAGISALRSKVGESLFERYVKEELEEVEKLRDYFLSR